jgi:acylpyruvate hydrolase
VSSPPTISGNPMNQTAICPIRIQWGSDSASNIAQNDIGPGRGAPCQYLVMRLATILPPGTTRPVAAQIVDGLAVAYPSNWTVERLLAIDLLDRPPPGRAAWPIRDVELLAPVARPGAIFGIGLNYVDHAAETGKLAPDAPLVFAKFSRSSTRPAGPIRMPAASSFVDYEGELALVIGARGEVGGYAIANDVTARDLQAADGQWARAKGADTFCPWGPWITTADEVPDDHHFTLRTYVNEELRQEASTSELIHPIPDLLAHIRATSSLEPGDLILTGTPAGVGIARDPKSPLQSGDVVRIEIDLLGAIEQSVL